MKKLSIVLLALLCVFALVSCSYEPDPIEIVDPTPESTDPVIEDQKVPAEITIRDGHIYVEFSKAQVLVPELEADDDIYNEESNLTLYYAKDAYISTDGFVYKDTASARDSIFSTKLYSEGSTTEFFVANDALLPFYLTKLQGDGNTLPVTVYYNGGKDYVKKDVKLTDLTSAKVSYRIDETGNYKLGFDGLKDGVDYSIITLDQFIEWLPATLINNVVDNFQDILEMLVNFAIDNQDLIVSLLDIIMLQQPPISFPSLTATSASDVDFSPLFNLFDLTSLGSLPTVGVTNNSTVSLLGVEGTVGVLIARSPETLLNVSLVLPEITDSYLKCWMNDNWQEGVRAVLDILAPITITAELENEFYYEPVWAKGYFVEYKKTHSDTDRALLYEKTATKVATTETSFIEVSEKNDFYTASKKTITAYQVTPTDITLFSTSTNATTPSSFIGIFAQDEADKIGAEVLGNYEYFDPVSLTWKEVDSYHNSGNDHYGLYSSNKSYFYYDRHGENEFFTREVTSALVGTLSNAGAHLVRYTAKTVVPMFSFISNEMIYDGIEFLWYVLESQEIYFYVNYETQLSN